ncbi:MAG TPA: NHL repeat-containing protein [Thermoleophilaceae bacterium]|nr:NHL repeat-containing protein [Thermoleophilaceae bacterium]
MLLAVLLTALPAHARVVTIGSSGSGPGALLDPSGIAVASDGALFVAERGNARIQKLGPTGNHLMTVGSYGTGPGQFSPAWSSFMTAESPLDGSIYAADPSTSRVTRFTSAGDFAGSWTVGSTPSALEVDQAGDVWVANGWNLERHSPDGTLEDSWPVTNPANVPIDIKDFAIAGDKVFALGSYDWQIAYLTVYDLEGEVVDRWETASSTLAAIHRIAVDAAGEKVYGLSFSEIQRFDAEGQLQGAFANPASGDPPAQSGGMCAATPSRGYAVTYPSAFADLAVGPNGAVYVTDEGRERILRIEPRPDARVAIGPHHNYFYGQPTRMPGQHIIFDASGSRVPMGPAGDHFEWDLDGDGTFELDTGSTPVARTAYAAAGERTMRVRVGAPDGSWAVHTEKFTLGQPPSFAPPSQTYLTRRKTTLNSGANGMLCSEVLRVEWDLDGDGSFEIDGGANPKLETTFTKLGERRISVRVTRPGGYVQVDSAVHTIRLGPPHGPVGVSINDGAQYTKSPTVWVHPIWPASADFLYLSDDGSFKPHRGFPVGDRIRWALESSGPDRMPKTVYVRFGDVGGGVTYQDDIILDQAVPVVNGVEPVEDAGKSAKRTWQEIRIRARDRVSGIAEMQLTTKRRKPGEWLKFKRHTSVSAGAKRVFVRVKDRAGNRSRWRKAKL